MLKNVPMRIKNSKPFSFADLTVYLCVAAILVAAFIATGVFGAKNGTAGFTVLYDNRVAAEYRFSDGSFTVKEDYSAYFSVKENGVYFYPDKSTDGHYNLIVFDNEKRTAKITESTCAGHDCESMSVSDSGGFIYCAPHKLKIIPTGLTDPVSG